ncbi:methionine adenosyltransferase [Christensenellaceae bacterium OttesenSCG-928-M15]|nr:methionine adenosyltransferase [Christensenellaceae bacterium OttesenSCG-928-M15]
MKTKRYTAESVTQGHPDKLCDLIADAVLDECLMEDEYARVACEVMCMKDKIIIGGEISSTAEPDIERIALQAVSAVGYDPNGYEVEVRVNRQSPDIAQCVDNDDPDNAGAGDQGVMYGYATNETEEMLPLPCVLAHRITQLLMVSRVDNAIEGLLPDGKAQVTVEYQDDIPVRVSSVVVSTQHEESKDIEQLRHEIRSILLPAAFNDFPLDKDSKVLINPSGRFVIGGPEADTGLTGRKLMVDTYGGFIPHGGGAFSGKDCSKVDRSGAYMARYIAKNIVAAGIASRCLVTLAYAIGIAEPVDISVETFGEKVFADSLIEEAVKAVFDCRPAMIREQLGLYLPIYTDTTNFGHFGKEELPWEDTDKAYDLLRYLHARL